MLLEHLWLILLFVFSMCLPAFMISAEKIFTAISSVRLQQMIEDRTKRTEAVVEMLFGGIRISKNIGFITATIIITFIAAANLGVGIAAFAVAAVVMVFLIVVFEEFLPRMIVLKDPEKAATRLLAGIGLMIRVTYPIKIIFGSIGDIRSGRRRRACILPRQVQNEKEAENTETNERRMIQNVFHFGDMQVKDAMVPRTDIVAVDMHSSYDNILEVFKNEKYSRMPVYKNTIDNIVGILHVKDIFFFDEQKERFDIVKSLRKAHYTFESKRIAELLEEMRKKRIQMVVVADEYGGTAGIITMQDIIEEIFGDIGDEYDEDAVEITSIGEGEYIVDGLTRLGALNEALGTDLESEHYETIGGFVTGIIGNFPKKGEVVDYNGLQVTVLDVYRTRIKRLRIKTKV
ncbi:MAG TPA: hemolysin [Clostridiales bacterium]|nr:hemolysin [Clostridiales bacterium]